MSDKPKFNNKKTSQLQKLIDASAEANNRVHKAERALVKFCKAEWGFDPADHDLDSILDNVFGLCGQSDGMPAQEFIDEMNSVEFQD
jgi:hypothetical protein